MTENELQANLQKHKTLLKKAVIRSILRTREDLYKYYFRSYDNKDGSVFTVVATKQCAQEQFSVKCSSEFVVFKASKTPTGAEVIVTEQKEFAHITQAVEYFVNNI